MRKFLVVGCGGSGGRTLRLLVDQLRADLRGRGIGPVPDAWQFVHVDVPVSPDQGPDPLGDIRDLGGTYVALSGPGNTYERTSLGVESQLARGQLGHYAPLLGWEPRDRASANGISVQVGAGQYRAVGRMLTLPRLSQISEALAAAQARAVAPNAWGNIPVAERGDNVIIPIVIASLAGGSGAAMFLDVCRLVGQLPNVNPANIGVFAFTADVFAELNADQRINVEGNAMGALAEVLAAISRLSEAADRQMLDALGITDASGGKPPFARVLPIGSRIGGEGAAFGDGSSDGVFRGVARALAGVMMSQSATDDYVAYFLGNPTPVNSNTDRIGWGTSSRDLPFGSLGFASLSLGRDRYLDYAAQRLARAAVDHLVEGHRSTQSQLPGVEQLKTRLDKQADAWAEHMGLAPSTKPTPRWFYDTAWPPDQRYPAAREAVMPVEAMIHRTGQAVPTIWLNTIAAQVASNREPVVQSLRRSAYAWGENWSKTLESRAVATFVQACATYGLPFARELMSTMRQRCDQVVSEMEKAGARADTEDPVAIDPRCQTEATQLGKQQIGPSHALANHVVQSIHAAAEGRLRREAARIGSQVLRSYAAHLLAALETAADESLRLLETEQVRPSGAAGLAQLHSEVYVDWPDNAVDRVPPRFEHAQNEVLLTTSADFPRQFASDVRASAAGQAEENAIGQLRGQIIVGRWDTAGARQDESIFTQPSVWRPQVLDHAAIDGRVTPEAIPRYHLRFTPADIIARARQRLEARGDVFAEFANQSISQYLDDPRAPQVEREQRQRDFVEKFAETLALARPVVGVDPDMVDAIHQRSVYYAYSFSELPFGSEHPAAAAIKRRLATMHELDNTVVTRFDAALRDDQAVRKIGVFGSYQKVSPLCYSSLLDPIENRWATAPANFQRSLWQWKRTRPLHAALGMSREEALCIMMGWYLGRLLGLVRQDRLTAPEVLSPEGWLRFAPLLESEEVSISGQFDVLPAVLMTHVWAIVRCAGDPQLRALAPYEALRRLVDVSESNQATPPIHQRSGTRLLAAAYTGAPLVLMDVPLLGDVPLHGDPVSPVLQSARAGREEAGGATPPLSPSALATASHEAVVTWLDSLRKFTFDTGVVAEPRPRQYESYVRSVDLLRSATLYAEIAPLAMESFDRLQALAEAALELATSPPGGPDGPGGSSGPFWV